MALRDHSLDDRIIDVCAGVCRAIYGGRKEDSAGDRAGNDAALAL